MKQRNANSKSMKMQCSQTRTLDQRKRCDDGITSKAPTCLKVQAATTGGSAAFPASVNVRERMHVTGIVSGVLSKRRDRLGSATRYITTKSHTTHKMASQLMPLELIDRCIGSRMRVIMKGDKGESRRAKMRNTSGLTISQSSVAPSSDLMISSVCEIYYLQCTTAMLIIL